MSEDKIGQKPAYSVYKERDDLRQEYQKVIGERDTYRDLCVELIRSARARLEANNLNEHVKANFELEAAITKAESILGDSNAT